MSLSHAERLARWKEDQLKQKHALQKQDIDRIVAFVERTLYDTNVRAKPLRSGGARISATTQSKGGE